MSPESRSAGVAAVHRRRSSNQRGSSTAETAVLLPALAALLGLSLWALGVVHAQLRCGDASRTAARALARGEEPAAAVAVARALAPRGAAIRLSRERGLVVVHVSMRRPLPGLWGADGPGIDIQSTGVAPVEP